MLITTDVEVILSGSATKHYESLGYFIPRVPSSRNKNKMVVAVGTKILVKPEHLTKCSEAFVQVKCDKCDKVNKIMWYGYRNCFEKHDNHYYCYECAMKLTETKDNYRKAILDKYGQSFEQWCIKNDRQDILNRWDYSKNKYTPNEITFRSKGVDSEGYWFKCPCGKHLSELKNINNFVADHEESISCNACNSFAQYGIDNICEDFLEKYWDYDLNKCNPFLISRRTADKVWIKCQKNILHDSYLVRCDNFTGAGSRCPCCTIYKGEEAVRNYLRDNNLKFSEQYTFSDCKYKNILRFDFAVFNNDYSINCLIEYDGQQHSEPIRFCTSTDEEMLENFKELETKDNIKNSYCINNNIILIRIPYYDYDNISEILSQQLNILPIQEAI